MEDNWIKLLSEGPTRTLLCQVMLLSKNVVIKSVPYSTKTVSHILQSLLAICYKDCQPYSTKTASHIQQRLLAIFIKDCQHRPSFDQGRSDFGATFDKMQRRVESVPNSLRTACYQETAKEIKHKVLSHDVQLNTLILHGSSIVCVCLICTLLI